MTYYKQKGKKKNIKYFVLVLSSLLVCISAIFLLKNIMDEDITKIKSPIKSQDPVISNNINKTLNTNSLYSSNAILISLDNNEILLDISSNEKIYPASLTKIMTAILAIENLPDLNKLIQLPKSMFKQLYSKNASMAGFLPNEKVEAIDLIYGVLLPSGAESSISLANSISGSEKKYVKLMNEKAKELEMNDTNFTNTTGLHDKKHYSTVKDISKLLKYALKNDTFRKIYTSKQHTTKATNLHPNGITFQSTMFKHMDKSTVNKGTILGGKTGYTEEAKLCLASLAKVDGKEYILVTTNANGSPNTEQLNILDAFAVYNKIP